MHLITEGSHTPALESPHLPFSPCLAESAAVASGRPQQQQGLVLGDMGADLRHNMILSLQEVQ